MLKISKILSKKINFSSSLRGLFPFCHSRESGNPSSLSLRGAKQRSNLSGFSLIELMVAIAILAMAIFGIFHAYSAGFMGMADARDRTVATNYAREAMEDVKNKDFDQIITQSRNYIDGTKYEREIIVQSETNLKKVTTNVYWKDRNGNEKIVETDVAVYFIETTAGTPSKIILYAEPYNVLTADDGDTLDVYEDESIITAIVKDARGNTVTSESINISFSITTGSSLGGISSESEPSLEGKATTIFTASNNGEGEVVVTATATGLTSDSVFIDITDPEAPVRINLTADTYFMAPNTSSTSLITAEIFDAGNSLVGSATNDITFSVTGPGTLSSPTTQPAVDGEATITLTSDGTPGTITVTGSSSGLLPDFVTIITGGKIDLFLSNSSVAINETAVIRITTKDLYGLLINYIGPISLSVASYDGITGLGYLSSELVEFDGTYLKTVDFTATSEGKVKITATDPSGILNTGELILTITPALISHHIEVSAEPSSIEVGGNTSDITALMKTSPETGNVTVTSYSGLATFDTSDGYFSYNDPEFTSGKATAVLNSSDTAGTATVEVSSGDFTGTTDVGFYLGVDHIDLIANPQNILSGGGSDGTCTITAIIKEGINVVTGYDGDITFFIESGHPNGVVFVTTNKSSVIMKVVNGKAEIDLISKNWTGIARIKATIFYGTEEVTEYLNIPVVANKNLEIFVLHKKIVEPDTVLDFMNHYNPEGVLQGNWSEDDIVYGKYCVDNENNLYILNGDYIEKKNSMGDFLLRSEAIAENSYTINIGPDGYIYFSQNTGTIESPKYCVKKINPNTLVVEGIFNLTDGVSYSGLAIDLDGESIFIYIHNHDNQTIEKWPLGYGSLISYYPLSEDYYLNLSELAIAGDYIGGVGEVGSERKAFIIPKEFTLTEEQALASIEIPKPLYISSIDGDFLLSGLNVDNHVVFGRYDVYGSIKWLEPQTIMDASPYSDCIIGAYPF